MTREKAKWYIDRMIEAEGELVVPLDDVVKWYEQVGVVNTGRGSDKTQTLDMLFRANPVLRPFVHTCEHEDEK